MKRKRLIKQVKFHYYLLVMILVSWIFPSCSPEYIPNMVNSPMFSNQGEFQASIATGTSNFDAQTAFAITDNIGIMVNSSYGNETNDTTDDYHKHFVLEGGAGYYTKFLNKGRFELFGGFGIGNVTGLRSNTIGVGTSISNVNFNKYFIQPGIGISTKIFDGSFSPRLAVIDVTKNEFGATGLKTFIEPVFTVKVGYKYIKAVIQIGASIPFGDDEMQIDYQPLILNVGLHFNLGRMWDEL